MFKNFNVSEMDTFAVVLRFLADASFWETLYRISSAYLPAKSKITTVISFVARCGLLGLFDVYVARFVALKLLKLKQRRKRKLEQERERKPETGTAQVTGNNKGKKPSPEISTAADNATARTTGEIQPRDNIPTRTSEPVETEDPEPAANSEEEPSNVESRDVLGAPQLATEATIVELPASAPTTEAAPSSAAPTTEAAPSSAPQNLAPAPAPTPAPAPAPAATAPAATASAKSDQPLVLVEHPQDQVLVFDLTEATPALSANVVLSLTRENAMVALKIRSNTKRYAVSATRMMLVHGTKSEFTVTLPAAERDKLLESLRAGREHRCKDMFALQLLEIPDSVKLADPASFQQRITAYWKSCGRRDFIVLRLGVRHVHDIEAPAPPAPVADPENAAAQTEAAAPENDRTNEPVQTEENSAEEISAAVAVAAHNDRDVATAPPATADIVTAVAVPEGESDEVVTASIADKDDGGIARAKRIQESCGGQFRGLLHKARDFIKAAASPDTKKIKWEYVREKDGVRCYVNLEDLCWCMGIVNIRGSVKQVLDALTVFEYRLKIDKMLKDVKLLEQVDHLTRVDCLEYKGMWPVSGRYFILALGQEYSFEGPNAGTAYVYGCSCEHADAAPSVQGKGLVKGTVPASGYVIKARGPDSCEVTYVACVNLGGNIPGWTMKLLAKDQPMVAGALRDIVEANRSKLGKSDPRTLLQKVCND